MRGPKYRFRRSASLKQWEAKMMHSRFVTRENVTGVRNEWPETSAKSPRPWNLVALLSITSLTPFRFLTQTVMPDCRGFWGDQVSFAWVLPDTWERCESASSKEHPRADLDESVHNLSHRRMRAGGGSWILLQAELPNLVTFFRWGCEGKNKGWLTACLLATEAVSVNVFLWLRPN